MLAACLTENYKRAQSSDHLARSFDAIDDSTFGGVDPSSLQRTVLSSLESVKNAGSNPEIARPTSHNSLAIGFKFGFASQTTGSYGLRGLFSRIGMHVGQGKRSYVIQGMSMQSTHAAFRLVLPHNENGSQIRGIHCRLLLLSLMIS